MLLEKQEKLKIGKVDIDTKKLKTFEDWYALGQKFDKEGMMEESYQKDKKGNPIKYMPWSLTLRVLRSVFPNVERYTKLFPTSSVEGSVEQRPYYSEDSVNYVEAGFKVDGIIYTTTLPVMTNTFGDVVKVTGTLLNKSIQRAFVKAVAEHLGFGLHLYSGDDLLEDSPATPKKTSAASIRNAKPPVVKAPVVKAPVVDAPVVKPTLEEVAKPVVKIEPPVSTPVKPTVVATKPKSKPVVTIRELGTAVKKQLESHPVETRTFWISQLKKYGVTKPSDLTVEQVQDIAKEFEEFKRSL